MFWSEKYDSSLSVCVCLCLCCVGNSWKLISVLSSLLVYKKLSKRHGLVGFFFTNLLQEYMWKCKLFHADFLVLSGLFRYNPYRCSWAMMYWPHKESTLWWWLPLSAPDGKQNWCALVCIYKHAAKRGHFPLAHCNVVSSFPAGGFCSSVLLAGCENFLFCFCQGHSVLLEPFKWQLSSNSPCFDYSEFGSLLQQVHKERQMGPFPFFSSIPLHSPAIQLFPISSFFCVFCHTSASSLNSHLNSTVTCPGFPCSSF